MDEKEIKLLKSASVLKEALQEAVASFSDERINSLIIIDIKMSRGKYDADVYLEPSGLDEAEQRAALKQLKVANSKIKQLCLTTTGWFKCPNFHFKFDDSLTKANSLDDIFKKIEEDKKNR